MNQVNNLAALRTFGTLTDVVLVQGHTNPGDGGGGFFYYNSTSGLSDDNGAIISSTSTGFWLRQIDGYINVRFFGAFGHFADYTAEIQSAIDFAYGNNVSNNLTTGNTLFFPCGNYLVDTLVLKRGVSLLGESADTCVITASSSGPTTDYMIKMDTGPIVWCNISNLSLTSQHPTKGCMHFEGTPPSSGPLVGGIWNSNFKNIWITSFVGHGIYLDGGTTSYDYPNQFLIFENVVVTRTTDTSASLLLTGQQGQITFLNCTFDGSSNNGANVAITAPANYNTAVVSFINCTIQSSEYGISLDSVQNITIDNCWFENLDIAIKLSGTNSPCKSINIVNNRFANASSYGGTSSTGRCIDSNDSEVNVLNNFAIVTDPSSFTAKFLLANSTNLGVHVFGNSYQAPNLGMTYGIMQYVQVQGTGPYFIDAENNREVFIDLTTPPPGNVSIINSDIRASESLWVRADQGTVTFEDTGNIFLTLRSSLTLNNGDAALFTKIDNIVGPYSETYQLTTFITATTP